MSILDYIKRPPIPTGAAAKVPTSQASADFVGPPKPKAPSVLSRVRTATVPKIVKGGAAIGLAGGAIKSSGEAMDYAADPSNSRVQRFRASVGSDDSFLGNVAADTARVLGNIGNAATLGYAGKLGRGIASSIAGEGFGEGWSSEDPTESPAAPTASVKQTAPVISENALTNSPEPQTPNTPVRVLTPEKVTYTTPQGAATGPGWEPSALEGAGIPKGSQQYNQIDEQEAGFNLGRPASRMQNSLGITPEAFDLKGGGSFSVATGPRGGLSAADWNSLSQEEATAIRVAELQKDAQARSDLAGTRAASAYRAGKGPLTVGARDTMLQMSGGAPVPGAERGSADWQAANPGAASEVQGIGAPSWDEAMKDYAAGRVGSEGYKMIRNMKLTAKNEADRVNRERRRAIQSMPAGRDKRAAMARYKPVAPAGLKIPGEAQKQRGQATQPGVKFRDQLDLARFGADQENRAYEREQQAQTQAREQEKAARKSALEGWQAAYGDRPFMDAAQEMIPEGFPVGVSSVLAQTALRAAKGDPSVAAQIVQWATAKMMEKGEPTEENARQWIAENIR